MSATTASAPFTRAVVRAMQSLYPTALADSSWDNTGLLLEAPFDPARLQSNTVLLTIDLTKAVADEAIALRSSIIVSYHPIIFRGLKSLTLANTQQQTLLRLASKGISVYSPHTAVDAAPGGLGDWLADIVTASKIVEEQNASSDDQAEKTEQLENDNDPFVDRKRPVHTLQHHPSQTLLRFTKDEAKTSTGVPHTRQPIVPQKPELASHPGAGMGRIVHFKEAQPLTTLLDRIGRGLNNPKGFPIAIPQNKSLSDISIQSVGICAGSGASLLSDLDVDLLFTGEMSHHETLAAIERGQVVISLFHSNSERGFLGAVLLEQLEDAVATEWAAIRDTDGADESLKEALADEGFDVVVSEADRDPYGIVILKDVASG